MICGTHGRIRCSECAYVEELKEDIQELKKALEWASRIIGSGLDGSQLRYDPMKWMITYHAEWKEQTP
jgi:hypothetical protein